MRRARYPPAREIPAARLPQTPRFQPALPGSANTVGRRGRGALATALTAHRDSCGYSSVTGRATSKLLRVANAVFGHEFQAKLVLIRRSLIIHVEDFGSRPNLASWIAMA